MDKFIVGSKHFFGKFDDFNSKDTDIVRLTDTPDGFRVYRHVSYGNRCVIDWKRMTPEDYITYHLAHADGNGLFLGKFLVKEFADEVGFTIEHLKQLRPLVEKLDKKHRYEEVIFNAYVANNSYTLTDEQLGEAYDVYKQARKKGNEATAEVAGEE